MAQGPEHIDVEMVKSYAQDLRNVLEEASFTESKTFLRSFIEKIVIDGSEAVIHYNLPVPPDGKKKEQVGVLPIVTPGGAEGIRTPYLLNAIQSLSQLSYSPMTIFYNLWVWFYHPYAGASAVFDVKVSSSPSTSTTTVSPSLNSPLRT